LAVSLAILAEKAASSMSCKGNVGFPLTRF
jgi:hypothetical protein